MMLAILTIALAASPADEVRAAVEDLRMVADDARPTTRYLTLYAVADEDRADLAAAVSYVLNAVSRAPAIARPAALCDGRLLRFDLRTYGLPTEAWELLVADGEPYFHLTTEVLPPKESAERGAGSAERDAWRWLQPTRDADQQGNVELRKSEKKAVTVFTDGGWVDLAAAAELRGLSHSTGAVLRADWFVARAAVPPHYYRLAGVSADRDGWYRDLGIDPATVVRLRANHGANILRSGVTRHVRRASRWQGPLGGAWQTYDVSDSRPGHDPFRAPVPGDRNFRSEAGEFIAAKANGLHLFGLYDAAGQRQDAVPDRVAKDDSDPRGDGIIRPLLSCVRCHVEDGLRPIQNDQRRLVERGVELYAESPELAARLAEFYLSPKFERDLDRDRQDYAAAVERATGMDSRRAAGALAAAHRAYAYHLVTAEQAARELGLSPAEFAAAMAASDDPVILALVAGLEVQRQQWEGSYAQGALLCR